jgi:CRP-like cAMP-binding protein
VRPDPEELQALPLFADLSPQQVERVASWLEQRHVEEGVRLTAEEASGYTFFVIVEGDVAVLRDEAAIASLGPGDFFREGALLGTGSRRNADEAIG